MKRIAMSLMVIATIFFLFGDIASGRGPGGRGGGGGGRGGGGARAGGGVSRGGAGTSRPSPGGGRSPSLGGGSARGGMTRPSTGASGARTRPGTGASTRPVAGAGTRPNAGNRPATRPGTGGRPSAGELSNFLDIPRPTTGAIGQGSGARPGGAAADFLSEQRVVRPETRPAQGALAERGRPDTLPVENRPRADNREQRRQDFTDSRPNRVEDRDERQGNRAGRRDEVRDQINDNYPRLDFWTDYPNWAAWRINRPYRWATWGALTGWVGYGTSEPIYYDYGTTVYYEGDTVYSDEQPVATAEEYAEQAATIASSGANTDPAKSEWLPLGVFAITQDGQSTGSVPTLFVQLAISKEGVISGTLNNKSTGETQTLEGMVDKESQRAAWGVAGQQWPIMETGISNLTQDSSPALIHFANGQTQQVLLVRLAEPTDQ